MFRNHGFRTDSDMRKLLYLAVILFSLLAVAYFAHSSDGSSAEPTDVDAETYYYDRLNDNERLVYEALYNYDFTVENDGGDYYLQVVVEMDGIVDMDANVFENELKIMIKRIMTAFMYDCPERYWMNGECDYSFYHSEGTVSEPEVTIDVLNYLDNYGTTPAELSQDVNDFIASVNAMVITGDTRYAKVVDIHRQVCEIATYDESMPEGMGCRNAYQTLFGTHLVVCEGYAKAFKALCDKESIPCLLVDGQGIVNGHGEPHMWNLVQMENGQWYLVDCTWDDQDTIRTNYLLAGKETRGFYTTVAEDHILSTALFSDIPDIRDKAYTADKSYSFNVPASIGFRKESMTPEEQTAASYAQEITVVLMDETTPVAKFTFPKEVFNALPNDQVLRVEKIPVDDLDPAVRDELDGAKIFRITYGSTVLSGTIKVGLYYEKSALDDLAGVNLYYVDGGTLTQLSYSSSGDFVMFETDHFSDYAVKGALQLDGLMWFLPIIGILLFAVAGFYLSYRFS